MCFFEHSFAHNFFVFHFVAKPMLEFRENMMFFRIVLKFSNNNYLWEKSSFFAAPEVAWCLSIVGQAAKATTFVAWCEYAISLPCQSSHRER